MKYICRLGYGDSLPKEGEPDGVVPVFGSNGPYATTNARNTEIPAIVIGRKGSYGKVNWASNGCFASDTTFYVDKHLTTSNLRWLYWSLQTLGLDEGSQEAAVPGLNRESVYEERIYLPSNTDQETIANYLDRETTRIDQLITEKEKMLVLLEEKRTALISRVVTRGLDPNAALKPSGQEWLGDIPAHWRMSKLKYIGETVLGLTFSPDDLVNEGDGVLVLRASNVKNRRIVLEDNIFVQTDIPKNLRTRPLDILICSRSGSRALVGKNALITKDFSNLTFGAFMTIYRSPMNNFLFWVFNSRLFEFQASAFGTSTINQLTTEVLANMEVPVPPIDEREAIADFLEQASRRFDSTLSSISKSIDLIKERRSALITAAVTGQIPLEAMIA